MQRFSTSDLERLEALFSTKGFTYSAKKTDEREGKPPLLTLELKGSGTLESIHKALLGAPFVLTDMSSRKQPDGLSVRLQLVQGKVLEDDGWQPPTGLKPEMWVPGKVITDDAPVPEMGE